MLKNGSVKWLIPFLVIFVFAACSMVNAAPNNNPDLNLAGYWDIRFTDGKTGYMTMDKQAPMYPDRRVWVGKVIIPQGVRSVDGKLSDLNMLISFSPHNIQPGDSRTQTHINKKDAFALREGDQFIMIEGNNAAGSLRGYGKVVSPYTLEGAFSVNPSGWQINGAKDFIALLRR